MFNFTCVVGTDYTFRPMKFSVFFLMSSDYTINKKLILSNKCTFIPEFIYKQYKIFT